MPNTYDTILRVMEAYNNLGLLGLLGLVGHHREKHFYQNCGKQEPTINKSCNKEFEQCFKPFLVIYL